MSDASELPPNVLLDIVAALRSDRLLEAVKIYHEARHTSLLDAKKAVESLRDQLHAGQLNALLDASGVSAGELEGIPLEGEVANALGDISHEDLYRVLQALQANRLIDAVKIYRESKHCSLREAKDAVDAFREQMRNGTLTVEGDANGLQSTNDYTPPVVDKSSGCFGVLLFWLTVVGVVIFVSVVGPARTLQFIEMVTR